MEKATVNVQYAVKCVWSILEDNASFVLLKQPVIHYVGIILLDLHSFSGSRGSGDFESFWTLRTRILHVECKAGR